jgi:guanylate kinase
MEISQPTLFVVSAPSGAGKTTIIKRVLESTPQLALSVSHTSRLPRKGEREAEDYHFISAEEFKYKINNGDFLEWAKVHGNYYGTSKEQINRLSNDGKLVLLDIDVQGALQIKEHNEMRSLYIFIVPPSLEELQKRLENRQTETQESIALRIENAKTELSYKDRYDYVVINDDLKRAVNAFKEIIIQNAKGLIPPSKS